MSAIFSSTKVEKDNSDVVIAAANLAPVTQTNSVNIDHTLLTDGQLIEVAQALVAKKAAEAKVDATKAAEALELKQKQELLKVTNALAATTRKLRTVTESAAKTHEELLFQEIYLEEAQTDICAAVNESEVVGALSAAMTKDDARAILAARRTHNNASAESKTTTPKPAPARKVVKTKEEIRWEKISSMIKNQSHAALAYKMTKEQALARCQGVVASQDNAKRTMLANIWAVSVDVWGPTPQVLKQAFAPVVSAPSFAEGDGQDIEDDESHQASPDDDKASHDDADKVSPDNAPVMSVPANGKTGVEGLNLQRPGA